MKPRLLAPALERQLAPRLRPYKLQAATLLLASLLLSKPLYAAIDEATLQGLIAQVAALTEKVNRLEAADQQLREENISLRQAMPQVSTPPAANGAKRAWTERLSVKGDLRYRYENIDDASKAQDRNRNRLRARIEVQAKINDAWKVGLGLASGSEDPVSSNQSLGGAGSSKEINLDLAYFDWSGLDNTHIIGGKFKNPFYKPGKHNLIWDGDYRPEGLALKYDNGSLFANAAYLYLESDDKAGAQDEESIWGLQLGFNNALSASTQLLIGLSYYNLPIAGSTTFYGDPDDAFGNTLIMKKGELVYQNNYEELELFAELTFRLGQLPASLFIDWVENQDADSNETGWATGFKLGAAKNPGSWQFGYIYQDLEADAVFGLTTDSDFAGGGTNGKGHLLKAAYALDKNAVLAINYFINEKGDQEHDFDRLQMDLKLKY
ncbi:hypothetical protein A9Q89_06215 [Gammaproteobacteria bacterium 53_120_T64]|mgnify:CR=1 FL=1|nr:hypothetical protein A9Q89_06215 [Gammaproteobacteria bacterium 53_120_T64]